MSSVLTKNINEAVELFRSLGALAGEVDRASKLIAESLKAGHKLLACGNGGSAADAAHLTTEFVCRFVDDRRPYPAICFATHGGDMTAISNDYSYNEVFARQVDAFAKPGDLFIAFTTSGKSPNIVRALTKAKEKGIKSIAFLGRDGGACKGLADVELIITCPTTARIQEAHKLLLHTICEDVEALLGHTTAR